MGLSIHWLGLILESISRYSEAVRMGFPSSPYMKSATRHEHRRSRSCPRPSAGAASTPCAPPASWTPWHPRHNTSSQHSVTTPRDTFKPMRFKSSQCPRAGHDCFFFFFFFLAGCGNSNSTSSCLTRQPGRR